MISFVANFSCFLPVTVLEWFPQACWSAASVKSPLAAFLQHVESERDTNWEGVREMRCTVISRVALSVSLFLTVSLSLLVKAFLAAIVWLSHPEGNSADGGCGEMVTCFIQSTSLTQSLSFIFFYFSLRPRKITMQLGRRPQNTLGMNLKNLWLCGLPCNQWHVGCKIEKVPSIFPF